MSKEWEIDPINLFAWLNAIPLYPKIFWSGRNQKRAIAAVGISSLNNESNMRFGWRHFMPTTEREWGDFAPSFFFVPRFEVIHENNHFIFRNNSDDSSIFSLFKKQEFFNNSSIQIQNCSSLPIKNQWIDQVGKSINAIQNQQFEKIVMARRVTIDCTTPIDSIALCQSLYAVNQTVFFIQPTPTSAFLGATPEMLFERRGQEIRCDALAGTRQLHQTDELFNSKKDLREFLIVQKRIIEALTPLCSSTPTATQPKICPASYICHIYSQIVGNLQHKMLDEALLDLLHPTPAVGGYPSKNALDYLMKSEPFARGLYAAPIGWTSPESADFAVGIRSCLIQSKRAYLYAGTGIVEGSDPLLEWEETKHKLAKWNHFFGNFDE